MRNPTYLALITSSLAVAAAGVLAMGEASRSGAEAAIAGSHARVADPWLGNGDDKHPRDDHRGNWNWDWNWTDDRGDDGDDDSGSDGGVDWSGDWNNEIWNWNGGRDRNTEHR
jgi:hypothetical protein